MTTSRSCPRCRTEISISEYGVDEGEGLCPRCLLVGCLEPSAVNEHPVSSSPPSSGLYDEASDTSVASRLHYFGDYELLEEIGCGGMGVIYKARQVNLKRLVALKMILSGKFAGTTEVRRFLLEAEAAANLNHPNIVTIYEVGQHEGRHYLAMQLVEGESLAQRISNLKFQISNRQAAELLAKVARAVHYAHQRGILHRDLKPANILLDQNGEPHVADFGLARRMDKDSGMTMEGAVIGTPSFMAPEQAAGKTKQLGPPADIYSLGAILYYLLTGRPPFAAESTMDILVQVLEGEAIRPRTIDPGISEDLEGICLRCLEKSADRRYASAAALADDLERYLRGENVEVRPKNLMPLLQHWVRRQPALCSHLGGLAICAVIAQVGFNLQDVVPLALHLNIMTLLALWAVLSVVCQIGLKRERWAPAIPFLWCGMDVVMLTLLLWLNDSYRGPLMALYPALIVASGLWFRVTLVMLTAGMSFMGYGLLMVNEYSIYGRIEQFNWHAIVMVNMINIGLVVSYQVHRVRALSRFYEHRPLT